MVIAGPDAAAETRSALENEGVEVFTCHEGDDGRSWSQLLEELGRRRMTNVLVEGGAAVFGSLFDSREVDEIHAFIAPKLIGGQDAATVMTGEGVEKMSDALRLAEARAEVLGEDVHISGITRRA